MSDIPTWVRQAVYLRDDWKCRHCNNRSTLDPHHVVYRSAGGENTLNNLVTLCRKCHDDIHDGRLKVEIVELLPMDVVLRFWKQGGWKP